MEIALSFNYREEDLIIACLRKERWAQQKLYEDHYSRLMAICLRYASGEEDALDMLHEGYIKIFKNLHKYQPGTSLVSWMHRIMVNNCIDYYRKAIRRRTEDIEQAFNLSSEDADAISQCSEQEILQAVQQLSPVYRAVFNLYVVEGYSHKEIAEILDITESTSRSNLVKARLKLKAILTTRFIEYGEQ